MVSEHLRSWLLWFVEVHGCCVLVASRPHLVGCLLVWLFLGYPILSPWMCGCVSWHFFCGSLLVHLCLVARVCCLYSGIKISLFHLSDILIPDMLWLLDLFRYEFNMIRISLFQIKASLSCVPNITGPLFFSRSFLDNFLPGKAFFRRWCFQFQLVLGGLSTFSSRYVGFFMVFCHWCYY